jgi:MFS family permease
VKGAFRSLSNYNYRIWAAGALVSNTGTWMQRIAQDWLVLTQLTDHDATAVGIVTALQFAPRIIFFPWVGHVADQFDRRKLLIATQLVMSALALGLGILTVTGVVRTWHVYIFAWLLGCATAFDAPARQTFVTDMVGERDLSNAVALNSTSFSIGRMVGPAVAGVLISIAGTGWVLILNGISFAAVLCSLLYMRLDELHEKTASPPKSGGLVESLLYVWRRPQLATILFMQFLVGTFGMNFPIFISTMAVTTFKVGAGGYGLLTSSMAIGSVIGAFVSAYRDKPDVPLLIFAVIVFAVGGLLAAIMPNYFLFGFVLAIVGASVQTFTSSLNSLVQMSAAPELRGRVVAILLTLALGGQPIGAPLVGWVADTFGPRWALAVGASSGLAAAAVGLYYYIRFRRLRVHVGPGGFRLEVQPSPPQP